jgi:hypothetical protein
VHELQAVGRPRGEQRVAQPAGEDGGAEPRATGRLGDGVVEVAGPRDPVGAGHLQAGDGRRRERRADDRLRQPGALGLPGALLGAGDHQRGRDEGGGEHGHQHGQPDGLAGQRQQADAQAAQQRASGPAHEHRGGKYRSGPRIGGCRTLAAPNGRPGHDLPTGPLPGTV